MEKTASAPASSPAPAPAPACDSFCTEFPEGPGCSGCAPAPAPTPAPAPAPSSCDSFCDTFPDGPGCSGCKRKRRSVENEEEEKYVDEGNGLRIRRGAAGASPVCKIVSSSCNLTVQTTASQGTTYLVKAS